MLIDPGALEPAPGYAVVPEQAIVAVLRELGSDEVLRERLDRAFRRLEIEQPALADFLAGELACFEEPATQALAYFLFLAVYNAFREAFGARLAAICDADLNRALDTLVADGEVRSQTCRAGSFSQDVVALWQPALMSLVHAELDGARAAAEPDPILQLLLVVIVALTRAVGP